jgi:hypothetical protein
MYFVVRILEVRMIVFPCFWVKQKCWNLSFLGSNTWTVIFQSSNPPLVLGKYCRRMVRCPCYFKNIYIRQTTCNILF